MTKGVIPRISLVFAAATLAIPFFIGAAELIRALARNQTPAVPTAIVAATVWICAAAYICVAFSEKEKGRPPS